MLYNVSFLFGFLRELFNLWCKVMVKKKKNKNRFSERNGRMTRVLCRVYDFLLSLGRRRGRETDCSGRASKQRCIMGTVAVSLGDVEFFFFKLIIPYSCG